MPKPQPNWEKLPKTAEFDRARSWHWLEIIGLGQKAAITFAWRLTLELDRSVHYAPSVQYNEENFPLEMALGDADKRLAMLRPYIFGEEYPAQKNMAVRVGYTASGLVLAANVRNELRENLNIGAELLYNSLVRTLKLVELPE